VSRSYRQPFVTEKHSIRTHNFMARFYKRYSNKVVRKTATIPNGMAYKKLHQSYNIEDWGWYWADADYKIRRK